MTKPKKKKLDKLNYSNNIRWPDNVNVLEDYVIKLIDNQNKIIDEINAKT